MWSLDLDSMILMDPFQLRIFYDFLIALEKPEHQV